MRCFGGAVAVTDCCKPFSIANRKCIESTREAARSPPERIIGDGHAGAFDVGAAVVDAIHSLQSVPKSPRKWRPVSDPGHTQSDPSGLGMDNLYAGRYTSRGSLVEGLA